MQLNGRLGDCKKKTKNEKKNRQVRRCLYNIYIEMKW